MEVYVPYLLTCKYNVKWCVYCDIPLIYAINALNITLESLGTNK